MQLGLVSDRHLAERRLSELCALFWDRETPALKVADGQTGGVRVDKVADLAAAVGEDGRFILAVDELAVVDKEPGRDAVAEGLRLEFLELAEGNGVDAGQRGII